MQEPESGDAFEEYFVEDHVAPKLLVVGDDERAFTPLIERLKTLDIDVYTAADAQHALSLAAQHAFFLILMGADCLKQGGVELAFNLRANPNTRHVPVVFITPNAPVGGPEESYGYGLAGSDYVINAVSGDVVLREVSVFLELYRQKKSLEFSEQLYRVMATRDPLTLLANREQFETDLRKALANAKRHGYMIALLFIDLDRFKPVNDRYGHQAGDEVLQAVAERLKRNLREGDYVGRLGGDEFAVLLNVVRDLPSAGMVAAKLIDVLAAPYTLSNGETVSIGASIGVACFPDHGDDPAALMHRADMAMYRAKHSGRNAYRYWETD
ncbi:MAG: hypothetical protein KatS3mg121_0062 [Gammaproteobacteria bacterium]|nr:MAG: hypothetical protein KatS3mg121_0062 [Gammaproteobacteria bacterium]